jgi:hypothetical protein
MNIVLSSIANPINLAQREKVQFTRFDVEFQGATCSGTAYLFVFNSSPKIEISTVRDAGLKHSLSVAMSIDRVSDFRTVPGGREEVIALGPRGAFACRGRIIKHHFTGEGSIFQAGDVVFMIRVEMLPPYSLEVEEGTWVAFKAEGLSLSLTE